MDVPGEWTVLAPAFTGSREENGQAATYLSSVNRTYFKSVETIGCDTCVAPPARIGDHARVLAIEVAHLQRDNVVMRIALMWSLGARIPRAAGAHARD
jgi:hypothetical protein